MPPKISEPEVPKEGEHIFPASRLTPLAIEWQKYNNAGEHEKALDLLEEIVKGSTVMFERFAQYEGYDSTVDLPTLVLAAQEKVVKWLLAWKPEKGKLFSWFSKSLTANNLLHLADGRRIRIDEIVNNKMDVKVLSVNPTTGEVEPKRIINWIKAPAFGLIDEWAKLSVLHPSGYYRCLWLTWDHEMLTQRGWKRVDKLEDGDRLKMFSPCLTQAGLDALVGMRLGDGCFKHHGKDGKKTVFVIGHADKQRDYTSFLAEQFRVKLYDFMADDGTGKRHAANSSHISLAEMYRDHANFPLKKGLVTDWLLDHITARSLAYWWMDDGTTGEAILHTHAFAKSELDRLRDLLSAKFGLKTDRRKRSSAEYGDTHVEDSDKFFRLIAPHVIPKMAHKLPAQYQDIPFVDDRPNLFVEDRLVECTWKLRRCKGKANTQKIRDEKRYPGEIYYENSGLFTPDFSIKYDITVEDNFNFIAEGVVAHNCAKNVFKGEVVRANTYRTRIHSTGDSLEKYHGAEDHETLRGEVESNVRRRFNDLTVRWGSVQEIGAIRFLLESILLEDHEKRKAIQSVAYAFGLSPDLAKFFYNWVLFAMRNEMYQMAHVPFTEQDLVRHANAYNHIPDLLEIITWQQFKKLVMTLGGQRLKIPTSAQLARLKDNYQLYRELEASDKDPITVEQLARKRGKTTKSASEVWDEMSQVLRPDRSGEYEVFDHE